MIDLLLKTYLFPLIYLASTIVLGYLIDKFIHVKLHRLTQKTKWKGDDIVIDALKKVPVRIGFFIGVYLFIYNSPFSENFTAFSFKILLAIIIFFASLFISRIIIGFLKIKTNNKSTTSSSILENIIRIAVFITGALIIFQTFGVSITPLLTALGVGGLAVALALQDTLSNLFSGIQIIASQQIRTNDYVKLDTGEEGYVTDITWRNTTIRALPNNLVIVPNSKLVNAIIRNFQLPDKEIALLIDVGVSYNSDLDKVESVTIEAAKYVLQTTEGGVKDFDPFIRYHTFADSSINFTTILRVKEFTDQYLVKHDFVKLLHKKFNENEIEIPYPIRTIHLKK